MKKITKKEAVYLNKMYEDFEKATIIDKKILNSIDREKSLIGKSLIICDQLAAIQKKKGKEARGQNILFLIRLFRYNTQVYESLKKELAKEKELLKKRVNKGFRSSSVHEEIYKNVLKVADQHFSIGKKHLKQFKSKDESTHKHGHMALHHKKKAEDIYDTLLGKDIKKVIKRLAIVKLAETYELLIKICNELSTELNKTIKSAKKGNKIAASIEKICVLCHRQNLTLKHYAVNYSRAMIHSAEYIDNLRNKVIIYKYK